MNNVWHKISLSKEQVVGNAHIVLKDKLNIVYNLHEKPKDFACFFKAKNIQSLATIYLSPRASIECEFIINDYNAAECDPPHYSSMGSFSGNKDFSL